MVNPILARLREHAEAERRGEVAGKQILGGHLAGTPILTAMNAIGLIQDAAGDVAKAGTGVGLAAQQANPIVRAMPGSPGARASRAALAALVNGEGNAYTRARAANEAGASGNELAVALVNESFNPLNYAGVAGKAGQALRQSGRLPALARLLTGGALAGEGVNRASVLPLALIPGARRALLSAPAWLDDAAALAPRVAGRAAPSVANALESAARQAEAKGALTTVSERARGNKGGVSIRDLALINGKRQYGPVPPPEATAFARTLATVPTNAPPPLDIGKLPPPLPRGPLPPAYRPEAVPPPIPPELFDTALRELGDGATQGFERDFSRVLQPGERTAFGQLMEDLGPTENAQQFRRKNALALQLIERMGMENPLYERAGTPLDKVSGAILTPEQIITARGQIGNLRVTRPQAPEDVLAGRVGEYVGTRAAPRPTVETLPAPIERTARPQPLSREAKLARRMGELFPQATDEALDVAARPLSHPQRQPRDLAAIIAGRYGPQAEAAPEVFNPLRRVATPLAPLRDDTELVADRALQANTSLQAALDAAYGDRASFAFPALLKKLGGTVDRNGRIVANSRDITEDVLGYLDDHAKLTGRKAINARYGQLADEVTPPADATDAQLDELIAETGPAPMSNVDIPQERDWDAYAAEISRLSRKEADEAGVQAARNTYPRPSVDTPAAATPGGTRPLHHLTFRDRLAATIKSQYDTPEEAAERLAAVNQHADRVSAFAGLADAGDPKALGYIPGSKKVASSRYAGLYPEQYYASSVSGIAPEFAANIYDAHRRVVQEAIEAGEDVPAEVLADFPMLADLAPSAQLRGAGDIAAGGGGGGLGIAASQLPARTLFGAAAGGATGTVAGALAPAESEEERLRNAGVGLLAGTGVGMVGGEFSPAATQAVRALAPKLDDTMLDPEMHADALAAGWKRFQASRSNTGVKGLKEGWDAFWGQWRSQIVNTLKQLPQDALTRKFTNWGIAEKEFGLAPDAIRRWQGILRREQAAGVTGLSNPVVAKLRALGLTDELADLESVYGVDLGGSLDDSRKEFGGLGRTLAGAAIGLGAGVKRANPITVATGAARGYAAPFVDGYIRFLNGIQHDAHRFALAEAALDRDIPQLADNFLDELAGRGVDVTALRARGGYFSGAEVAAIAGRQAGQDWQALAQTTVRKQGDRIAHLAGDFRKSSETAAERTISKAVPFARWQIRYTPVLAEVAARHPRATAVAVGASVQGAQQAEEENLKGYQAGTIPLTDETPLVGPLVRARLGGQKGTVRLNPLGAVFPYGADTLAGEELPEDATGYQKVANVAGRAGFMPNPLVQSLAYVTGQDYKAPGALSRTSGIEGLADIPPVLLRAYLRSKGQHDLADTIPDLAIPSGRALLDAGRDLLSPVTGASSSDSDPTIRRYAELVMDKTGKPLSDPSNRGYLTRAGDNTEPLWEQAVLQSRLQGAAGNATGLVSPVQTMAQTEEAVAAQRAGKLPLSDYQISQLPGAQQAGARLINSRAIADNPAIATYRNISGKARRDQLINQWKEEHARLKRLSPRIYAERLKAYVESLK